MQSKYVGEGSTNGLCVGHDRLIPLVGEAREAAKPCHGGRDAGIRRLHFIKHRLPHRHSASQRRITDPLMLIQL